MNIDNSKNLSVREQGDSNDFFIFSSYSSASRQLCEEMEKLLWVDETDVKDDIWQSQWKMKMMSIFENFMV